MKPAIWHGCYDKSLNGFIVPAAFSHPAKFSLGLIERIYDHLLERGWLKRGDCVGDCFGGVAIGGLVAAYRKLEWCGVELESKFVALAEQNIALHQSRLNALGAPWPRIIQGDSRKFHVLIGESDAVVSSPPYDAKDDKGNWNLAKREAKRLGISEAEQKRRFGTCHRGSANYGEASGQIGRLKSGEVQAVISSPPYSDIAAGAGGLNTKPAKHAGQQSGRSAAASSQDTDQRYGQSSGQIAALKGGSVDACISSPPYAENPKAPPLPKHRVRGSSSPKEHGGPGPAYVSPNSQGQIGVLKGGSVEGVVSSPPYSEGLGHGGGAAQHKMYKEKGLLSQATEKYGESNGQIDNLKTGDVEAVVTSPPYAEGLGHGGGSAQYKLYKEKGILSQATEQYGESAGQIGQEKAESYWQAMDIVYRSCFQAIKPGGVIAIVVKDYCKSGKRVRLCDDTLKLLCHIGFSPLERIHAMLVSGTVEAGLFGEERTKRQRKSLFRRIYEQKIPEGDERRIDHEEVLICRKP